MLFGALSSTARSASRAECACKESWLMQEPAACHTFQAGCPPEACDGDRGGAMKPCDPSPHTPKVPASHECQERGASRTTSRPAVAWTGMASWSQRRRHPCRRGSTAPLPQSSMELFCLRPPRLHQRHEQGRFVGVCWTDSWCIASGLVRFCFFCCSLEQILYHFSCSLVFCS